MALQVRDTLTKIKEKASLVIHFSSDGCCEGHALIRTDGTQNVASYDYHLLHDPLCRLGDSFVVVDKIGKVNTPMAAVRVCFQEQILARLREHIIKI